jgi:hypothetical protein
MTEAITSEIMFMRWLDRLSTIAGALILSQLPQYLQQYTQRLGGHADETRLQVEQLHALAAHSGKSLAQYIHKFMVNNDLDFARHGEWMQQLVDRHARLSMAWESMLNATPLTRLYAYLAHLQSDVAKATLAFFQPALPLTVEAGVYALIGAALGFMTFRFLSRLMTKTYKKISFLLNSSSLSSDN